MLRYNPQNQQSMTNCMGFLSVVLTPVCRRRSLAEIPLPAIDAHYLARSQDSFLFAFSAAMVGAHEELSDCD